MSQSNNTSTPVQSLENNKAVMDTSLFENLIANNTSALSPSILEKNNSASLKLRAERELSFDVFTKVIGLEIWAKPVTLLLSQWPMPNAIEKYLHESELLTIPKQLALITLSTAYDEVLAELSNILSSDIILSQYQPYEERIFDTNKELYHNNSIPFTISLDDGLVVEACLLVDNITIEQFAPYISQVSSSKVISLHQFISPLYLEYGRSYLTLSEIKSIETGDILMMDKCIDISQNQIRLRFSSNQTFLAEKQHDSLSYQIIETLQKTNNSIDREESQATRQLLLSFDLRKTTISLDEIEKIGIGYTLDLPSDFNDILAIRYNNQEVGQGELVNIGKRVGLRITRLIINE